MIEGFCIEKSSADMVKHLMEMSAYYEKEESRLEKEMSEEPDARKRKAYLDKIGIARNHSEFLSDLASMTPVNEIFRIPLDQLSRLELDGTFERGEIGFYLKEEVL